MESRQDIRVFAELYVGVMMEMEGLLFCDSCRLVFDTIVLDHSRVCIMIIKIIKPVDFDLDFMLCFLV
jgi:hypothetical protein